MPIYAMMVGSLFSTFGNQLTALAVPWFVLETTGSASKTGLIAAVTLLPMVFSALFGGTVVDRVQQKHLAIGADVISGITVAAVPLFYTTTGLNFAGLMALMFLGAIFDNPGGTARSAMIPALARRAGIPLEQVNSQFGAIGSATQLFGAPVAGLLIAIMGAANVLWLNAATFALSAILVLVFVPMAARTESSGNSFISDVRQGFTYILTRRVLLAVALLATAINFLLSPLFGVALPYFAKTVYESSAKLGLMMGAAGLGGLVGALAYGRIGLRWSRRTVMLIAMSCFGIPIWIMALQPPVAVMCGLLLVMGFGGGLVNPMVSTMIQLGTPENMLGRVLGTLGSIAIVATPLGMILGGGVIGAFGLNAALIGTAAIFSGLLVIGFANPIFRELDRLGEGQEAQAASSGSTIPDASFAASES
jgi:MFS family permease